MVAAMRAKAKERLVPIRMLLAAIKQREIDDKITLDDTAVLKVIEKMIKQRRDSVKQFEAGNRPELAKKENDEITILQEYMPPAMSDADIDAAVKQAIEKAEATTIKDMGKVMGLLKPALQGRADMGAVSSKVKGHLSS